MSTDTRAAQRVTAFDPTAPLPRGTTVLEASAGTGKTWTIAALAARYVAEGTPLGSVMMVTFSRAASRELRTRIRERLERTRRVLERAVPDGRAPGGPEPDGPGRDGPGPDGPGPDAVDILLGTGTAAELELRRGRVEAALADFDAATIATTHEFCQQVLDSLGVLADADPRAVLVEQLDELTRDVCHDHYLQRFSHAPDGAPEDFPLSEALLLCEAVVGQPSLPLVPDDPDPQVRLRLDFAEGVRTDVLRRKRRLRLQTFDDVLTGLRDTLAHPEHGEAARQRLRQRFPVVLVDEFQDTDPVQWQILSDAFVGHSTLVLVGDPKQAIYAFRGADVHSYLAAVRAADHVVTLPRNHRSDPAVVQAVAAVFEGSTLGEDQIRVHTVHPALPTNRIRGADGLAVPPLRLRVLQGAERWSGELWEELRPDLVGEVQTLLGDGTELCVDGVWRPVRAGDLAVLVRTNKHAEQTRVALAAAGVPAVVNGGYSVHTSEAARDWVRLLTALVDPRQRQVREAALTMLLGWDHARLATATDAELAELSRRVKEWSRLLETDGVAAVAERVSRQQQLPARLLGRSGGERDLTDLRHVAEGLHQAQTAAGLGAAGLLGWLQERIAAGRQDGDERARRLESDADAVQVLTYHHSKGLQFPVVLVPTAWDCFRPAERGQVLALHDPDGTRVLDVGGRQGAGRAARRRSHEEEQAGEELRQLYVALTRAQSQVLTWWAPAEKNVTAQSGLHRMLHRPPGRSRPEDRYPLEPPSPDRFPAHLVRLEPVQGGRRVPRPEEPTEPGPLDVRRFERPLDLLWRRTSYSGLTAAAHGQHPALTGVGSDPAVEQEDDEPRADPELVPAPPTVPDGPVSPLADFPGGTAFGSLVHALLEHADPHTRPRSTDPGLDPQVLQEQVTHQRPPEGQQAGDQGDGLDDEQSLGDGTPGGTAGLLAQLTSLAAAELTRLPRTEFGPADLARALLPALHTPLGPLLDDLRLVDLPTADRLAELDFELPLAGGRSPGAHATLADVADCLGDHLTGADPLAGYPDRLRDPLLGGEVLRGFLTGSIDAVLRTPPAPDGSRRHLVVDYKTNWLGPHDGPLRVGQYHPRAMAEAMMASHYPLQAVLYCVALHRHLRLRLPGYRPGTHLGGVLYLFVRGMAGPSTPTEAGVPYGVFSWHPPAALVQNLSVLLAHGPDRPGRA